MTVLRFWNLLLSEFGQLRQRLEDELIKDAYVLFEKSHRKNVANEVVGSAVRHEIGVFVVALSDEVFAAINSYVSITSKLRAKNKVLRGYLEVATDATTVTSSDMKPMTTPTQDNVNDVTPAVASSSNDVIDDGAVDYATSILQHNLLAGIDKLRAQIRKAKDEINKLENDNTKLKRELTVVKQEKESLSTVIKQQNERIRVDVEGGNEILKRLRNLELGIMTEFKDLHIELAQPSTGKSFEARQQHANAAARIRQTVKKSRLHSQLNAMQWERKVVGTVRGVQRQQTDGILASHSKSIDTSLANTTPSSGHVTAQSLD